MPVGSETTVDRDTGVQIINETSVSTDAAMGALAQQHPELALLVNWSSNLQQRGGGIFERDRYLTPLSIFHQFRTALDAAETDDIVSGVLESTESLAFTDISIECEDEDEEDIWNQILDDIDIYTRTLEMWRELFIVSQFYVATYWVKKDYKVRGNTSSGNKKRKSFSEVRVPGAISILDPLKIVPVGNFLFGQEQLAYIADRTEAKGFDQFLAGVNSSDMIVGQLLQGRYLPDQEEKKYLLSVTQRNMDNLFLMNPQNVWRHTATKPAYQRFATIRMKSVFELLDLKQQLRQADRAHLIGNTNFIVLVKKGSDTFPAKPEEVSSLANQVKMAARVPVIVGDHRLDVEIITPKMDSTLIPEKYNALDARVTARLFQVMMTGNYAAGASGDDSIKLARVVARGMEARRNMIGSTFFKNVILPTFKANPEFTSVPQLHFHPKRIALDFDPNVLNYYQELRDRGDLSRETILSEMDIDQEQEFRRRLREKDRYDDAFKPPMAMLLPGAEGGPPAPPPPPMPAGAPKPAGATGGNTGKPGSTGKNPAAKTGGRAGGRKGGSNRDSFKSGPPRGANKAELDLEDEATEVEEEL